MNGFYAIGSLLGPTLESVDPNAQWEAAQRAAKAANASPEKSALVFQEALYRQWLERRLPVPVRERPSRIPVVGKGAPVGTPR